MGEEQSSRGTDTATRITHVPQRYRYEISADGEQAGFTAYIDDGERRIFYHTEIEDHFAGRGLASTLVAAALSDARNGGQRIVAVCPYIAEYLKSHHGVDDVLDPVTPAAVDAVRAAIQR